MSNNFGDFCWGLSLFMLALFLAVFAICKLYETSKNSGNGDFDQSYLLSNTNIIPEDIISMLDFIIDETIEDYTILNIPFKEGEYVNSEKEREILSDISTLVMSRMTPAVIARLSLIYIISDDEDLSDLITKKVYIKVIAMVVSHNSIKDDNEKKDVSPLPTI